MPIAPTPGPPHSRCARRASAISHHVTGLEAFACSARNSALACALEYLRALVGFRHGAVAAEQRGHVNGKTRDPHPAGEARHVRADPRHLAHDDHRRARAGDVDASGCAIESEVAPGEIFERVVLFHAARRHGFVSLASSPTLQ